MSAYTYDYDWCDDDGEPYGGWFVEAEMEAHEEAERQARIAAGLEHACAVCGCSESRACAGGCIWVTETLCSRCAAPGRAVIA